jgi:hypothetical protein
MEAASDFFGAASLLGAHLVEIRLGAHVLFSYATRANDPGIELRILLLTDVLICGVLM